MKQVGPTLPGAAPIYQTPPGVRPLAGSATHDGRPGPFGLGELQAYEAWETDGAGIVAGAPLDDPWSPEAALWLSDDFAAPILAPFSAPGLWRLAFRGGLGAETFTSTDAAPDAAFYAAALDPEESWGGLGVVSFFGERAWMLQPALFAQTADMAKPPSQVFEKLNRLLAGGGEFILVPGVICILVMLVMPLPTWMLDVFIGINISVAALILLLSLYIADATRIPSFPTILLLSTLFRLALNVSATRLILLQADAGEIIAAFGTFVVGGNYVVGAVVFLILTLIQFIVIAKGSERVAEVSARFTLDAIPGKQMSIDADLRGGLISPQQATTRRRALEKESQLFGAMDGAMKFVKGDAIAGIVISLINIIGGLIIGVFQQGMAAGEAAQIYTLLTIGDGLVSQIPALLMTTSAGLVVTRVGSGAPGEDENVARDIFSQVLSQPRAMAWLAVVLTAMIFVPGFPRHVFAALALVAGFVAYKKWPAPKTEVAGAPAAAGQPGAAAPDAQKGGPRWPDQAAVLVGVHPTLAPLLLPSDAEQRRELEEGLNKLRVSLSRDMGLFYPPIAVRATPPNPPNDTYTILVDGCPAVRGMISPTQALLLCHPREAQKFGLSVQPAKCPWDRMPACLLPAEQLEKARTLKLSGLTAREVVLQHTAMTIRRHSADFLGIQETRLLLDEVARQRPNLVQVVTPNPLPLQAVTEVLQRLLRESVPISNRRLIFESMARWGPTQKNPFWLTELVRGDMRKILSYLYVDAGRVLQYYSLDHDIVQLLRESARETATGPVVNPSPEDTRAILSAVGQAIQSTANLSQTPIVLTYPDVRRLLRSLVELEFPEVVVLAFSELLPDRALRAIGRIAFKEARTTTAEP